MSSNSNFKKDKCWSCEYFSGKREYKDGFLLGPSVQTDYQGTCSCKYSHNSGKKVSENDWCSRFQKWGVLQSYLATETNKREQERIARQQQQIFDEQQQKEIEKEHNRVEDERRQLEHEKWLASLSPEERSSYEANKKQAYSQLMEEIRQKNIEEEKQKIQNDILKIKRTPMINFLKRTTVIAVTFLLGWIPYWIAIFFKNNNEMALDFWKNTGHSETDAQGQTIVENIARYNAIAIGTIWIPFVILAIGIVISVVLYCKAKRLVPDLVKEKEKNNRNIGEITNIE